MTQDLVPALTTHPFVTSFGPKLVERLAECAERLHFPAGEFLFRQGDDAEYLFLVRYGSVAIELATPAGPAVTIQSVIAGEVVGWSWIVPPYTHQFDARAMELTRVIALEGASLRRALQEDHELGYVFLREFVRVIADRLAGVRLQLVDLYGQHAPLE